MCQKKIGKVQPRHVELFIGKVQTRHVYFYIGQCKVQRGQREDVWCKVVGEKVISCSDTT